MLYSVGRRLATEGLQMLTTALRPEIDKFCSVEHDTCSVNYLAIDIKTQAIHYI